MLAGVVIVCSMFYTSILPFSGQKQKTVITKSIARCNTLAEGKSVNFSSYDLDTSLGRKQFEIQCGVNGKDCILDKE